jgi:hypothetical protein
MNLRISFLLFFFSSAIITYAQNVGIGTNSPNVKLDVRGSTTDDGILIGVGNSDKSHVLEFFGGRQNDPNPFIRWKKTDPLRFATDSSGFTEFMRIDKNGHVGIGLTNPGARLEINGGVKIADSLNIGGQLRITSGSPGAGKVLTSNAAGLASWTTPAVASSHYIGESYGGGIVVAVWKKNGVEHGLIASLTDISASAQWSSIKDGLIGATAQSQFDGQANTTAIVAQGDISGAAYLCDNYTSGGFNDWYLPAAWELNQCYNAAFIVNTILGATNGFQYDYYWSSTETTRDVAWYQGFVYGYSFFDGKLMKARVRAVRRF